MWGAAMLASDFKGQRPHHPAWSRRLSYIPLYGLLIPAARTLELLKRWDILARVMGPPKPTFGGYVPTDEDVIVCSYFKSGTNWVMQMAIQILFRGEADYDYIHDAVAWPDRPPNIRKAVVGLEDGSPLRRSPTGKRLIKTHLSAAQVPINERARYIAVVRDPKDVCVSAYHMMAEVNGRLMPRFEHFVELFLSPHFAHGYWADHLCSYWALRDRPNVWFLTYEEIKADHQAAICAIADFIGVEFSDQERAEVERLSNADHMRRHNDQFDPGQIFPWSSSGVSMVRNAGSRPSELMTPALGQRIDAHFRAELKRLGCDFPYEATYGR